MALDKALLDSNTQPRVSTPSLAGLGQEVALTKPSPFNDLMRERMESTSPRQPERHEVRPESKKREPTVDDRASNEPRADRASTSEQSQEPSRVEDKRQEQARDESKSGEGASQQSQERDEGEQNTQAEPAQARAQVTPEEEDDSVETEVPLTAGLLTDGESNSEILSGAQDGLDSEALLADDSGLVEEEVAQPEGQIAGVASQITEPVRGSLSGQGREAMREDALNARSPLGGAPTSAGITSAAGSSDASGANAEGEPNLDGGKAAFLKTLMDANTREGSVTKASRQAVGTIAGVDSALAGLTGRGEGGLLPTSPVVNAAGTGFQSIANGLLGSQTAFASLQAPVGSPRFGEEFVQQMGLMAARNLKSAQLLLNPLELGPMEIKIVMNKDQANIQVQATTPLVRDLVEGTQQRLREMLASQGIEMGRFDVGSQHSQQRQSGGDSQSQAGEPGGHGGPESAVLEEAPLRRAIGIQSLVDYYA